MSSVAPAPKFLVTGGTGWLGQRLLPLLQGKGRIRCLIPAEEGAEALMAAGIEVVRGDIRSAGARHALLKGADGATLFHLAGVIHPYRAALFDAVNHKAAVALIDEAAHLRRAVVMSSNSPLGCNIDSAHRFDENSIYHPYMGYGRSKMNMEMELRTRINAKAKPAVTLIRAPWFYGPGQPPRQTLFFRMIRDGRMPIFGDGTNRRSMAYTDSLAQGLILAADNPAAVGEIFWMADAEPYTMNDILATVADVLEKDFNLRVKRPPKHLPEAVCEVACAADLALQAAGLYNQKIHVLGEMNKTIACDITKAERVLGYKPLVDLREGMRRSIQWCVENGQTI